MFASPPALIDIAFLVVLSVVLGVTIGEASVDDGTFVWRLEGAVLALFLGLAFLYYFALEATIGQTVGKLLVGLRVVGADGGRPSVSAVAIRTVVRIVDWLPLLYLVGFITMIATRARRQRLGDVVGRTGIARAAPLRHRGAVAAEVGSAVVLILAGSVVSVAVSDEGEKSYSAHGISFDYPADWEEISSERIAGEGDVLWKTVVGDVGQLDLVTVTAYRLDYAITADDLDAIEAEIASIRERLSAQIDGTVEAGPEAITMGGRPGIRYEATGILQGNQTKMTLRFTFDDVTEYEVNCQSTKENAADIERGCNQIKRTFEVGK